MDNNLTRQKHLKFDVILANGTEYPMQGEPVAIDRNVDAQTGTINIVGHIPNPNLTLRKSNFALRDLKKEKIGEPYHLEV